MKRACLLLLLLVACAPIKPTVTGPPVTETTEPARYAPRIDPAEFTSRVTNNYFTLTPGTKWTYQAQTEEGTERNEVIVLDETRLVMGVETVVVWDRVWLNDELIEETKDWYAQDTEGNVWYFGEDSQELLGGKVVNRAGSWEAGVDGAQPGIIMQAAPRVGMTYRQEYYEGQAEDMADVLALDETITVPYGTFSGCLKTRDYTPLEPGADEHKYYCPQVGNVALEVMVEDNQRVELIQVTTVTQASVKAEARAEPAPELKKDVTE